MNLKLFGPHKNSYFAAKHSLYINYKHMAVISINISVVHYTFKLMHIVVMRRLYVWNSRKYETAQ
jgi:hypothetical protein